MDWTGFTIPFSITDITNGVLKTLNSFMPIVLLVIGMSLAFFGLAGLLSVFRGDSFWDAFHRD